MRKLIPDLDRDSRDRERAAREVLKKSADQRKDAYSAVIEAYRKTGIAIEQIGHGRRWDDD